MNLSETQILENIQRHKAQADISVYEYFRELQRTLTETTSEKRRVYLDTKYWILLRDVVLGRARNNTHTEILRLLRYLVLNDIVICPLSDAAYIESMQQSDEVTRLATAELMDELSCGIAVVTEETRVRNEFLNFFADPNAEINTSRDEVWVKTGFVLGENLPYVKEWDENTNRFSQKSFIDLIWHQSVADFAKQDHNKDFTAFIESANKINVKMVLHADEIRSFEQAVQAEFSGCVKQFNKELAARVLSNMGLVHAKPEEVNEFQTSMQTMLFNLFRSKPDFMLKRVPTLFIHAMCHAAIRWNKGRKIDSHWLLDIHHACAGLAYHDAMFTEHPLRALLISGKMRLDQRSDTVVLSAEQDVINYLQSLC